MSACSQAQSSGARYQLKGGPCEGCEAVFEYSAKKLRPVYTLPDFKSPGPRLKLTGHIFRRDGHTPAANVILYIYHTNQAGRYAAKPGNRGWAKRHGELRGWIKTDETGRYTFYTLKPGTYPSRSEPAHVHATVLEPDGKYYYLEEWYFRGDPLLSQLNKENRKVHGGEGTVSLRKQDGLLIAERDIILGLNVGDYE